MELQKQTLAEAEAETRLVPYVDWQNGYAAKLNCVPTPLYMRPPLSPSNVSPVTSLAICQ